MSFFDRFKKDDDDANDLDPFGADSSKGSNLGPQQNSSDMFSTPPPMEGNPQSSFAAPTQNLDFTNPDINASTNSPRPRQREYDSYEQPSSMSQGNVQSIGGHDKDFQIVIAKLDAIKSEIESLHQRVKKIEQIAEEDKRAAQGTPNYGRW